MRNTNFAKKASMFTLVSMVLGLLQVSSVFAATTGTELSAQVQEDQSLSIVVVDADGATVAAPSYAMSAFTFSSQAGTTTGALPTAASGEKIRVANNGDAVAWGVSIAATDGETSVWSDGTTLTFDYNDADVTNTRDTDNVADVDTVGGTLTLTAGTLTGVNGCNNSTGITLAGGTYEQGVTASVALVTATTDAEANCAWDLTAVGLSQTVPEAQKPASYTLDMTITIA